MTVEFKLSYRQTVALRELLIFEHNRVCEEHPDAEQGPDLWNSPVHQLWALENGVETLDWSLRRRLFFPRRVSFTLYLADLAVRLCACEALGPDARLFRRVALRIVNGR